MANIKSAEKRIRTSARKRSRNKARVSRLRGAVKRYRQTDAGKRAEALPATHSEIDRALAKGVIHRNAAARYKSRLAKKAKTS
jgi:small subunit ribosomal protein S20